MTDGKRWNYKAILTHLAEEHVAQNKHDADVA